MWGRAAASNRGASGLNTQLTQVNLTSSLAPIVIRPPTRSFSANQQSSTVTVSITSTLMIQINENPRHGTSLACLCEDCRD